MAVFSLSGIRTRLDSAGSPVYTVVQPRPSLVGRIVAGAMVLAVTMIVLTLVVVFVVPALIIAVAGGLFLWAKTSVRRALGAARGPNGVLDGRQNVRVVVRDGDES